MSSIISIGTALPAYGALQQEICNFMQQVYNGSTDERKRLQLLYERSGIHKRYSAVPDYNSTLNKRELYPNTSNLEPFPSLEKRMELYQQHAPILAQQAIVNALENTDFKTEHITHLITVSCTGMAAPGLDLQLMEILQLKASTQRTAVNFMGCYAAVHGLKMADAIAQQNADAIVCVVCVELCTLHFQKTNDYDNLTANAIFGDGAASCIVAGEKNNSKGLTIKNFYSEVHSQGKQDMAWQLSSTGFLMTLSSYIPQLIETNINSLLSNALAHYRVVKQNINHWAIHPGGRKILEVISTQLQLEKDALQNSYEVLKACGNMSSPTILFVLKKLLENNEVSGNILGAAFGPGLTMETFYLTK
jgi:predicted naringenin-chalcone synthase